jgi:DNA-binding winged helix-turn-helix (wHTH) protein/Tol biopolymer transport system component
LRSGLKCAESEATFSLQNGATISVDRTDGREEFMQADFRLGDWLVQPSLGRITGNGHTIQVRAKVMDLLVFLAQHHGEVISKDALLDGVWGTAALSESALTRTITELRQALEDDAERPHVIETIPKRGYRLVAPVVGVTAATATSAGGLTAAGPQADVSTVRRLAWRLAGLALGAAAVAAWAVSARRVDAPRVDLPVARFLASPPEGTTFAANPVDPQPAVSPDGRQIVTVAMAVDATRRLWVRALDSPAFRLLSGTEGACCPFWSPDSNVIGFFADGRLKKIRESGGPVQTLSTVSGGGTWGTWSPQGVLLFAPNLASGLYTVPSSGGQPVPLTTLDPSRHESSHRFPYFLPDGSHYNYLVRSSRPEHQGIFLGSMGTSDRRRLVAADSNAVYVPGYLLFVRESTLIAEPFDLRRLELAGESVSIAERVVPAPTLRSAPFSASPSVLAYRSGGMHKTRLVWTDRAGSKLGTVGPPDRYLTPALSPDGKQLLVDIMNPGSGSVDTWVVDLTRHVSSRLTFGPSSHGYPVWAPDSVRFAFASDRRDAWNLYQRHTGAPSDMASDHVVLESATDKYPQEWSSDGASLVYVAWNDATKYDVGVVTLTGDRKPVTLLRSAFNESQAQLSPDGRWLAYTSDESGRFEVYLQTFPPSGPKWLVSAEGGCQPRWRADGRELFYLHSQQMMSVSIEAFSPLKLGTPTLLFNAQVGRASVVTWDYVAAADGRRFLLKDLVFEEGGSPIEVTLNWQTLLRR